MLRELRMAARLSTSLHETGKLANVPNFQERAYRPPFTLLDRRQAGITVGGRVKNGRILAMRVDSGVHQAMRSERNPEFRNHEVHAPLWESEHHTIFQRP